VLVFHQNAKGHESGDRVVVGEAPPPVSEAAKYQVFHATSLALAPGDVVRVTRNGKTADGRHRLNNGALYGVAGFDARGDIVLANGWTVGKEFGHLAHGYCVTSHASQGKTVDRVFVSESSQSFPAASREQFYVSVSRGRESAVIYTDDKAALKAAVGVSDDRTSATELVRDRVARQARLPEREDPRRNAVRTREIERVHG
jgi:hypothetical protein